MPTIVLSNIQPKKKYMLKNKDVQTKRLRLKQEY